MPILFLVYISRVFEKVLIFYLAILALSFVDDLDFIALGYLIKEVAKTLGQIVIVILDGGKSNPVIYDIAKTETVFFLKSHCQQLNK